MKIWEEKGSVEKNAWIWDKDKVKLSVAIAAALRQVPPHLGDKGWTSSAAHMENWGLSGMVKMGFGGWGREIRTLGFQRGRWKHPHVNMGPPGCWVWVMGRAWACETWDFSSVFDLVCGLWGNITCGLSCVHPLFLTHSSSFFYFIFIFFSSSNWENSKSSLITIQVSQFLELMSRKWKFHHLSSPIDMLNTPTAALLQN